LDYNNPDLAVTITGVGMVLVGDGASGASTLTLTPADGVPAGMSPGGNAGVLNVKGGLTFAAYAPGPTYPLLDVEVVGHGGAAGTDHDQVAVTGAVNGIADLDVVVTLPVPSCALNPDLLGDMAIMTGSSIGTGTVNSATIGKTIGQPLDTHWQVKSGEELLDYADPTKLVLKGASIEWTAISGDANLDGQVGIADLGALADNYGKTTGVDWMKGDFNFDCRVGIADLGAIADHYGDTEGGVPVPEPAALALVAVAAVALVRRRK